jgi:hypothetical protein
MYLVDGRQDGFHVLSLGHPLGLTLFRTDVLRSGPELNQPLSEREKRRKEKRRETLVRTSMYLTFSAAKSSKTSRVIRLMTSSELVNLWIRPKT